MKPVYQTIELPSEQIEKLVSEGKPYSNCIAACLASILELNINDVPFFQEKSWEYYHRWLYENYKLSIIGVPFGMFKNPKGYSILTVATPPIKLVNGKSQANYHCVVCEEGKMIHNPIKGQSIEELGAYAIPMYFTYLVKAD